MGGGGVRGGAVIALALLLGACTGPTERPAPTGPATSPPAATAPRPTASAGPPLLEPTATPMDAPEAGPTGAPAPVWDDASRASAADLASRAMTAYARPAADPAQWWTDLSALLSPGARGDYQWVDPAAVAATAVTGPARVVEEPSVYLARVAVPTDAGEYVLLLSRQDGPTPWSVERIDPPAEVG